MIALVITLFLLHHARRIHSLPSCESDRPNSWTTHRTVTIPSKSLTGSDEEDRYATALCCVYTHVVSGSSESKQPTMTTYDDSTYNINGSNSIDVMKEVMKRVCKMSMGSQDCKNQAKCVERALEVPPVPPSPLSDCDSDRPGSQTHRTLTVPKNFVEGSAEEMSWIDTMCCIYTHIESSPTLKHPKLTLYDGSSYDLLKPSTLTDAAEIAKGHICKMQMGSDDCANQATCMKDAFYGKCIDSTVYKHQWEGKKCRWLSKRRKKKRKNICGKKPQFAMACKRTCKMCGCVDDSTFKSDNVSRCKWLGKQLESKIDDLCKENDEVSKACKKTCKMCLV